MSKSVAVRHDGPLPLKRGVDVRGLPALMLALDDLELIEKTDLEVLKPMNWKVNDIGW
ncbi:MAG: hypothetical protein QXU97_02315 [Fervidicoccaceae archaeon]